MTWHMAKDVNWVYCNVALCLIVHSLALIIDNKLIFTSFEFIFPNIKLKHIAILIQFDHLNLIRV